MASNVYDQIRADIVSGDLAPGTALVELTMADRYGTSRTPIREALRRLEQDGLVERADRGMRVRMRSSEEILEIYDVRISLETTAARWAAERRTELDLARLHRSYERMTEIDPKDHAGRAETNQRFHETVWMASHNGTLIDMLRHLNAHLARYPISEMTGDRWSDALEEHHRLIEAIERRDVAQAAKIAEAHVVASREVRLRMATDDGVL